MTVEDTEEKVEFTAICFDQRGKETKAGIELTREQADLLKPDMFATFKNL